MYSPVGIQQLSSAQIRKLLLGGRVRVKAGSAHKVSMVQEHAKKLASASKKGAGIMLQLDPYACDLNREHLEGCGLKSIGKKLSHFVKTPAVRTVRKALRPVAQKAFSAAERVAMAGIDSAEQQALAGMRMHGGSLKSFSRGLTHFVRTPAVRTVRTALRPVAQQAFNAGENVAMAGIDRAEQDALSSLSAPSGEGLKSFSRGLTKFVRSPAVKTVRKALRPVAQKAFSAAERVAKAGIDSAEQQALAGMGVRGIASRARRACGGALFPAGY